MAVANNGRTPSCFGQAFMPLTISGGETPTAGQPARLRTWGIPTGPGWWDRPGKWNYRREPPERFPWVEIVCGSG